MATDKMKVAREAIAKAQQRLDRVCKEQAFKLHARIPATEDDDDLVIGDGLHKAAQVLAGIEAATAEPAKLTEDDGFFLTEDGRKVWDDAERNTIQEIVCRVHPNGGDAVCDFWSWWETEKDKWLGPHRAAGAWLYREVVKPLEKTAEPAEPFEPPAPYVAPPRNDEPTEVGVKWLRWFFDRVFDHGTLALMSEDWRRAADIVAALAEPAAESGPSDAEIAEAKVEHENALLDNTVADNEQERGSSRHRARKAFNRVVDLMRRSRAAPVQQSHDWPEDFDQENGRYIGNCIHCGKQFMGHKRRHVCKVCVGQSAAAPQPVVDSEYRSLDHAMEILRSCGAPYSGEQAHKVAVALKQSHDKRLSDLRNIRSLLPSYPDSGFGGGSDMELRAQEAWERSFGKIARRIESMLGGEQQEVAPQPVVEADVPDDIFAAIQDLAEAAYEWAESDTEADSPLAARERAKDSELQRLVAKLVADRDRVAEALRGLVEACGGVIAAYPMRDLDEALRAAKEVLRG